MLTTLKNLISTKPKFLWIIVLIVVVICLLLFTNIVNNVVDYMSNNKSEKNAITAIKAKKDLETVINVNNENNVVDNLKYKSERVANSILEDNTVKEKIIKNTTVNIENLDNVLKELNKEIEIAKKRKLLKSLNSENIKDTKRSRHINKNSVETVKPKIKKVIVHRPYETSKVNKKPSKEIVKTKTKTIEIDKKLAKVVTTKIIDTIWDAYLGDKK